MSSATSSDLAKKTLRRLNDAMDSGKTGAMSEVVQTVRKLSGQIATVSIQELADIIARDPSVTEKVISAANTFAFNPTGVEIATINEALHTVGFERIRNLTVSIMLAQNAGNGVDSEEQREMAGLSVSSGLMAQSLVSSSAAMSADPEIAFVSASLRNYGKLLMSTYFTEEYRAARQNARQGSVDEAYLDAFGITPLDLGHQLLSSTNLPDLVMTSLETVPPEKLTRSAQSEAEEVLLAAEFSVKVCELAFDEDLSPEAYQKELNALLSRFGESLPFDQDSVSDALVSVQESLSQINQVIGVKDESSHASRALHARIDNSPLARRPAPAKQASPSTAAGHKSPMGMPPGEDAPDLSSVIDTMLEGGEIDADIDSICGAVCGAIVKEVDLSSCMAFLPDPDDKRGLQFTARQGVGPLFDRIKNRPLISSGKKDIFGICLNRGEDILIQDPKAGKIASVIPEWIHDRGEVNSLVILPVAAKGDVFALFLGVRNSQEPIEIEPLTHMRLKQFRNGLADMQVREEN